jgi:hypothetical protein
MPTVENPKLTINQSTTGTKTTASIQVKFTAVFTPFDQQLAALGLVFHPHITVLGMDGDKGTDLFPYGDDKPSDKPLFPHTAFVLGTPGTVDKRVAYDVSKNVDRTLLQEDSGSGQPELDDDDIQCKIVIHASNLPPAFTEDVFTPLAVLQG